MSLQGENENVNVNVVADPVDVVDLGGKVTEPELSNSSALSPLDDVPTSTDLTDAVSEESNNRIHPQDSVEDYADQAVEQAGDQQMKKKKSMMRSFKKGASKRYKALARKSKEVSGVLGRSFSGRLSFSRSQKSGSGSEEDAGSEVDMPNSENSEQVSAMKIQQAFRSYSAKKRTEIQMQVKEEIEQNEAATKIQAAARGHLTRVQSHKLREEQLEAADKQEEQKTEPKKKGGLKRLIFTVVTVAAVAAVGIVKSR